MSIYKGGYITIDMLDEQIGDELAPVTFPGIYAKIKETWGKPIVFKNINLQGQSFKYLNVVAVGTEEPPISCWLDPLGTVKLAITDEDAVYVET